jgi:hypothetical protein
MAEETKIKLQLTSTQGVGGYPQVNVNIEQQGAETISLYTDEVVDLVDIEKTVEIEEGKFYLTVEMTNHSYKDVDGKKNKTVSIDLLEIEDIDIKQYAYDLGEYTPTEEGYPYTAEQPTVRKNELSFVWNGKFQFEMESPVYIWLLENL